MLVLVTRPLPDAEHTAALLRARGHSPLLTPLLEMRSCTSELPRRPYAGVLVTSANALRALADNPQCSELTSLPLFAVGMRTAAAAHAMGFREVHAAGGNADALAELVAATLRGTACPLLYLAPADRAYDMEPELARQGLTVETVVIYRMDAAARFPPAAARAIEAREVDAVLHYSRRTAEAYVACADAASLREAALEPLHCCLSVSIAGALRAAGAARIRVTIKPKEARLLALLDGGG